MEILSSQDIEVIEARKEELNHAEAAIERAARNAFEEWGAQLKHIRDNKLYFGRASTWEEYCQDRWEMTPQRAGQLIDAFDTFYELKPKQPLVSNGETNGFILPTSERQIRPLGKLKDAEQRAEVWRRVVGNTNGTGITAKLVEAEVERYKAELDKNWITLTEWNELEEDEKLRLLTQNYQEKTFNQTNDNIEWARWSWNPITGCLHNCDYCYARDIANRFYPQEFEPSIIPSRLNAPINTKRPDLTTIADPAERLGLQNVFVCSMADLFGKWVPVEWIEAVLNQVRNNPQWNFLLLTKFPIRMSEFDYPDNAWLGTSVDAQHAVPRAEKAFQVLRDKGYKGIGWVSCEPMMERITFDKLELFDWLVLGGASKSTKTPEFKPPFEWINHAYNQAKSIGCKVYMKTNLLGDREREYPTD